MADDTAAIAQLERALALQKKAFLKNQYPPIPDRIANVSKIATMVMSNREAIREALHKDFGNHPNTTADLVEVLGVAGRAAYVASKIEEWTKFDDREIDPQMYGAAAKAGIRYQPKGVIGNIIRTV